MSLSHAAPGPAVRAFARRAVAPAVLAGLILAVEAMTLGLGLDWAVVGLFGLPAQTLYILAVPLGLGALGMGAWLCRRAYAAELANQAEQRALPAA